MTDTRFTEAMVEIVARALCLNDKQFVCDGCKEVSEDHDGTCDAPRSFLDEHGYAEQARAALTALTDSGSVILPREKEESV